MKCTFVLKMLLIMVLMSGGLLYAESLVIYSIPPGADVTVNAAVVGLTPLRLEGISGQTIQISVSSDSYQTFSFDHQFTTDQTIFIDLEHQNHITETQFWEAQTMSVEPEKVESEVPAPSQTPILISPVLKEINQPPDIPSILRHESGEVVYDLSISDTGRVSDVNLLTEDFNDDLRHYFEEWISTYVFDPAFHDGEPQASRIEIKIDYTMETGKFIFPSYDMTLQAGVQVVDGDVELEEEASAVPSGEVQYYSESQVDQKAMVFKPPIPGDTPIEIIDLQLTGIAEFMIFIDPEGNVGKVDIVAGTGNKSLDDYLVVMIQKSYWEPAIVDGTPVGYERSLTLDYNTGVIRFNFIDL